MEKFIQVPWKWTNDHKESLLKYHIKRTSKTNVQRQLKWQHVKVQ